jgi:hypothetical protein
MSAIGGGVCVGVHIASGGGGVDVPQSLGGGGLVDCFKARRLVVTVVG